MLLINGHIISYSFTFFPALILLVAVNHTSSCFRCLFRVFLTPCTCPNDRTSTLIYNCLFAYFSKYNENSRASPTSSLCEQPYQVPGQYQIGRRTCITQFSGKEKRQRKGSGIGRMESSDGELCVHWLSSQATRGWFLHCKLSRSKERRRRLVGETLPG